MGGLLALAADSFTKGEGAEAIAGTLEKTSLGRDILSLAGNKEWETGLTAGGKVVGEQLAEYHRIRLSALGEYSKNVDALKNWHQSSDAARNALPLKTSTIGDIHDYAVKNNQPIQNVTKKILGQNLNPQTGLSNSSQMTLEQLNLYHRAQARLDGIVGSLGAHYENIAPIIAEQLEHTDPRIQMNGQRLASIVSNELKDTTFAKGTKTPQAGSAVEMNRQFSIVNKFRRQGNSEARQIPLLNTEPTYTSPKEWERVASSLFRTMQIPLVAIPHIGQYFHLPMSAPISAIGKALLQVDKDSMLKTVESSSIHATTMWDVIHSDLLARSGKIAEWTKSPTAASIIQKSIHQPLFNWFRLKQLSAAGAVGFHSAIFWANAALKGNKRALAELAEMGINPEDVIKQQGKLTEEQLQKGVYHFVNNRFFFQKTIDNSLLQNRNFIARGAFMYHSFINSETAYLRRELVKMSKAGDIKGIAQFVGTLGIVFPAVAPLLKSAELFGRTGSLKQSKEELNKDYSNLAFQNGVGSFTSTYFDMLAHIGAAGAFYNYTNAIKGHRLANALLGPMIGTGVTDIEDVVNAGEGKTKKPLGRDILQQTIPVLGKPLSHILFPTTSEEHTTHHRTRRSRRRSE